MVLDAGMVKDGSDLYAHIIEGITSLIEYGPGHISGISFLPLEATFADDVCLYISNYHWKNGKVFCCFEKDLLCIRCGNDEKIFMFKMNLNDELMKKVEKCFVGGCYIQLETIGFKIYF